MRTPLLALVLSSVSFCYDGPWQPVVYDYYHIDLSELGGQHRNDGHFDGNFGVPLPGHHGSKVPIPRDVIVDVINELGIKLLAIHNEHNENNIAISPYGAFSVLAALTEGLQGEAAHEILHAAHIPKDKHVLRVGLRDIHRHLKSYFIPEEGFLAGLTLNLNNVTLKSEYEDVLHFYGFDYASFNNALYPEPPTTKKPAEGTTTLETGLTISDEETTMISTEKTEEITAEILNRVGGSSSERAIADTTSTTDLQTTIKATSLPTTTEGQETTTHQLPAARTTEVSTTTSQPETSSKESPTTTTTLPTTTAMPITTEATTTHIETITKTPETTTLISTSTETTTKAPETTIIITTPKIAEATTIITTTTIKETTTETTKPPETTTILTTQKATTNSPETTTILTTQKATTETTNTPETTIILTTQNTETTTPLETTTPQETTTRLPETTTLPPTTTETPLSTTTTPLRTTREVTTIGTMPEPTTETEVTTIDTIPESTTEAQTTTISTEADLTLIEAAATEDQLLQDLETTTPFFFETTPDYQETPQSTNFDFNYNNYDANNVPSVYDENNVVPNPAESVDVGNNFKRQTRSVVDYVIARFYDDHHHYAVPLPPPRPQYIPQEPLTFAVYGKFRESGINFMKYDTVLPYFYVQNLNAIALSFPLDSSKYYLLLLLPLVDNGVDQLVCDLRLHGNLRYVIDNLKLTHVVATIPSFMLKGYVTLTPALQRLGIRKIFEPRQADFSPMTNVTDIYVTNIEQAVTVTIRNYLDPSSQRYKNFQQYPPVYFKADHPFLYFVVDSELHVALMIGKVINPLNSRIR